MRPHKQFLAAIAAIGFWASSASLGNCIEANNIGSRFAPFLDDYLIERFSGRAELRLHRPVDREVVIAHDQPWEGNTSAYHSVFQDGDIFRMYYRGSHNPATPGATERIKEHPSFTCYAESKDGIHWVKPNLGLFEFNGTKDNNIVFSDGYGNFAPFVDKNPVAKPDEKYKAVAGYRVGGLYAYTSNDGIHWKKLRDELVITDDSLFDSLNLAVTVHALGEKLVFAQRAI